MSLNTLLNVAEFEESIGTNMFELYKVLVKRTNKSFQALKSHFQFIRFDRYEFWEVTKDKSNRSLLSDTSP